MHSVFFSLNIRGHAVRGSGLPRMASPAGVAFITVVLAGVCAATAAEPVSDDAAAARGLEIFTEADARDSGYGDLEVDLRMTLRSARGNATERALRIRQLEMPDDGDRVLVVFDTPANIRGTALLSHGRLAGQDDQWLFLPALNRVKKIASRNKTGPFLGSEFSFEDLSPPVLEKFSYRYVEDAVLEGVPCHVVDRFPLDEHSGYARQRVWLDVAHLTIRRIEFTNRREAVVKVLTVSDYVEYLDRYFRPGRMFMENLRSRKSTELTWRNYRFGVGFGADRDFSMNSLRRVR